MLKTLDAGVAKGDSETTIIQGFVEEFGTAVLSEPPKSGLNLVAWYLPSVTLFAGALLVVFVISRWRKRPVAAVGWPRRLAREYRLNYWLAHARKRRGRRRIDVPPSALLVLQAATAVAGSDWAVLGACLALAAATLLFIFYIQPDASDLAPHRTKLDQLMERRDTIYDNFRDLRFEYRSGKYSESDYEAMKVSLENEAALILAEIDQVTDAQMRRPRGTRPTPAAGGRS